MTFRRTTTRDVELHGQPLPPGEKVVLFYHSGNRDERAFDRPWTLDITRSPNRHLGFGGGGPHYCLGASLARAQLRAIFGEILRVVPDIEGGRARAAAQCVHPRRQADAVQLHPARLAGGRGVAFGAPVAVRARRPRPRAQHPTRALWTPPWDVRHVGRDQRPKLPREGLQGDVKHIARPRPGAISGPGRPIPLVRRGSDIPSVAICA